MTALRLFFMAAALFTAVFAYSQNLSESQWIFGSGNLVNFEGADPVAGTFPMNVNPDDVPAVISNDSGDLLLAANRNEVYGANGEILPNGNFNNFAFENMFVPIAGTNDYYLIRSYGGSGMTYSRVDMDLNDGLGDVVEGEKDISFYEVSGHLMVASKADGSGHWLISADNQNGTDNCYIRTFDVTDAGLIENDIYFDSWTWVGWESTLDEARISPDCSLIAVAFKGHYLALFQFDNEEGVVTDATDDSFDNLTSFGVTTTLEFSPNSEYLYTIGDESSLVKFNISSFNSPTIQSSLLNTGAADNPQSWDDLKRAPNGKLYVLYSSGNDFRLDCIENPDDAGEVVLTPNAVSLEATSGDRFPNTPNLFCAQPFFVNPETNDVCLGDSTFFSLNFNQQPDSILWDFDDPDSGDENFSEDFETAHFYENPGSYDVEVDVWFNDNLFEFTLPTNVFTFPNPDLGDDLTVCEGETVTLDAGEAQSYEWNTGDEGQIITVAESGTYSVLASNGLCEAEDDITVTVIPLPVVDLGSDVTLCELPPYTIEANTEVTWFDGSIGSSIEVDDNGTYTASITNECFTVADSVEVAFVVLPESPLAETLQACEGDSIFLAAGFPEIEGLEVNWSGNGLSSDIDSLFVSQDGVYTVSYEIDGCSDQDQIEVDFLPYTDPYQLVMPNVFTPNGDAVNRYFEPVMPNSPGFNACTAPSLEVNLRIYNRWGNNLLENECRWDGLNQNELDVSEGTYYYIVDLRSVCLDRDELRTLNGSLTLIRGE